jgi:outer membrane lipoprotein carrier protein
MNRLPHRLADSPASFISRSAFVLACACLLASLPQAACASGTEQFKTFIAATHSARANFAQSVVSKSGRKPQVSQGTLAFSRPGKFRWTYDKPYYQLIVGDGERLWIHDKDLNQVSVKKLGQALGSSPAALLAGDNELEKNFVIKDAGSGDGLEMVDATPKSQDSTFSRVRIGFSDSLPRIMEVHDNFGQTTTLIFSQFERNPNLPASLFHFTPPQGADVVGE